MKTLIVYHRGGGKSLGYSPNCMFTIRWAINNNAGAIEYDVTVVKDNHAYKMIVIEPQLLLENGLDINYLFWEDVKKINTGNHSFDTCRVSTLKEILQIVDQTKIAQQIHLKCEHEQAVKTLVSELNSFENIVITSFNASILKEVKNREPNLKTGWLVKPDNKSGSEKSVDLTKIVATNQVQLLKYSTHELLEIRNNAELNNIDIIILCGPRIADNKTVHFFHSKNFELGAWGIGSDLLLARQLIGFGIDRFTIDNPEQL